MQRTALTLLTLVLIAIPLTADAEYQYLCTSVPGACEYTPASVPKLLGDVCYSTGSNAIHLKGAAACPAGTEAFNVIYGEVVDPVTAEVAAYVPLDDACGAGLCVDYVPHDGSQEYPMCCENGGPCWPGVGCGGIQYWCHDGVCNEDGTVTCYNAEFMGSE